VAVHKGFKALDTVRHVLTAIEITGQAADIRVVQSSETPDPHWLNPGMPSAGQQAFGDGLLARHRLVVIPSVVSAHSWNLVFVSERAAGAYFVRSQEPFALDTRLHPPVAKPR
jgi:RES domain-containing protein